MPNPLDFACSGKFTTVRGGKPVSDTLKLSIMDGDVIPHRFIQQRIARAVLLGSQSIEGREGFLVETYGDGFRHLFASIRQSNTVRHAGQSLEATRCTAWKTYRVGTGFSPR